MKNIAKFYVGTTLFILLLGLVSIGYFIKLDNTNKDIANEERSFERKKQCADLIPLIKKEMNKVVVDENTNVVLGKIFYSPIRKSCIYVEKHVALNSNGLGIISYIKDYYLNESLSIYSGCSDDCKMTWLEAGEKLDEELDSYR